MTYRNTRPEGFRTDASVNARWRTLHRGGARQHDTDISRVWFGSRDAALSAGEDRAILERRAEEASENEGMAEHSEKSRDPARWDRERRVRSAG